MALMTNSIDDIAKFIPQGGDAQKQDAFPSNSTASISGPQATPQASTGLVNNAAAREVANQAVMAPTGSMTDDMSVEKRFTNIMGSDNPLLTGARTRAAQAANSRGLINSSMGVQAGEMAAMSAALPIAQADAGTAAAFGMQNLRGQQDTFSTGFKGLQDYSLQSLRGAQSKDLANIEAGYKTLISSNEGASKLYQQATDAMNKIMTSDLSGEAKVAALQQQSNMLQAGLGIIGKISNIPGMDALLEFKDPTKLATTLGQTSSSAPNAEPQWLKDIQARLDKAVPGGGGVNINDNPGGV